MVRRRPRSMEAVITPTCDLRDSNIFTKRSGTGRTVFDYGGRHSKDEGRLEEYARIYLLASSRKPVLTNETEHINGFHDGDFG